MSNTFPSYSLPKLKIIGTEEQITIHNIYCIGRNYKAHAAEMGFSVDKSAMNPFYFLKSNLFLKQSGATIPYPAQTQNLHHEVELVVVIAKDGSNIEPSQAQEYIYGYCIGLDMTRRDLQAELRDKSLPWDLAKNFANAAIVSSITPQAVCGEISQGEIKLSVNGEIRQKSNLSQMIWTVAEIITDLSRYYPLAAGDLIFTGTPEGVSAVKSGDYLCGEIANLGKLELYIE